MVLGIGSLAEVSDGGQHGTARTYAVNAAFDCWSPVLSVTGGVLQRGLHRCFLSFCPIHFLLLNPHSPAPSKLEADHNLITSIANLCQLINR